MTEFGCEVWVLAAKRGITTQRALARVLREATGYEMHDDTVRNYLQGRTAVPARFLRMLDKAFDLTEEEKASLGLVFAWGETVKEPFAPPSRRPPAPR